MKMILSVLTGFLSNVCVAEIKVAFFTTLAADGKIVQFEPNGRFSHVAIAYRGRWLHVDHRSGVVIVQTLEEIGALRTVLTNPALADLTRGEVSPHLGKSYDHEFHWKDQETTYCAKLIGKLLNIAPTPMTFAASQWRGIKRLPIGGTRAFPDDIYAELIKRKFREE